MRFCEAFVPELPAFAASLEDVLSNCINQSSGQRTKISLNKFVEQYARACCFVLLSDLSFVQWFPFPASNSAFVRLSSTMWWDLRGGYTAQRPSSLIALFNILIEFSSSYSNSEHVNSEIYSLINW